MTFLPRQTIVVPLGIVTQPNQYGQYAPGALRVCTNWTMRNPGELVQAPGTQNPVTWTAANHVLQRLFPLDSSHIYTFSNNGTTWEVRESGNATAMPTLFTATSLFTSAFVSPVRARERLVINTTKGALVADSMAPTSLAERTFRQAGLPQPNLARNITNYPLITGTNGAMTAISAVGYQFCFARKLSEDYVVRSPPTTVVKFLSGVSNYNITQRIVWNPNAGILAGDLLEVYRTDGQQGNTSSSLAAANPGNTCKRVASYTLTAADITAGGVTFMDKVGFLQGTFVTTGPELYTNPFQEGPDYANDPPPVAKCVENFKGYTFYGNTTERPIFEFGCPGGIGASTSAYSAAYHDLYSLGTTTTIAGTRTSGSPTITGVAAADFALIDIGMAIDTAGGTRFPIGTYITAMNSGAGTITMSANATSSGASVYSFMECLELNGLKFFYGDLSQLLYALGDDLVTANVAANRGLWEMYVDQSVPYQPDTAFLPNPTVTILPSRTAYSPASITVRGSHGSRYSPPIPDMSSTPQTISAKTRENRLVWSKNQEPEHVPSAHETFVGFDAIIAMNATRDALWIWCTDGLYRLSGDGGADGLGFRVDLVDTTLILAGPQASTVYDEVLFGYTNVGFVSVDSAGNKTNLSEGVVGGDLPGAKYSATRSIIVERNETDGEILLGLGENGNANSDTLWVYNVLAKGFTKLASNGASLSNVSALAFMRDPSAGTPRLVIGVSPLGGGSPSYSEWNGASYLTATLEFQPMFDGDPLSLTQFIWADYLFALGTATDKTIVATWNGIAGGTPQVKDMQNAGYARAGCPRAYALAHSLAPGFTNLSGAPQTRFQGISVAMKTLGNQSKRR